MTLREQIEALDKGRQHSLDLTAALGFSDYELAIEYGWKEAVAAVLDIIDQHDCVSGREHAYSASIRLDLDTYKGYARELGLDVSRFEKDLVDLENRKRIDADKAEADGLGVTGTPGFFVNGRYLSGAKPFEDFAKAINTELGRLNLPVPAGAPKG